MVSRVQELIEAGQVLSRAGDKDGARRLVDEALRLDPLSAPAQELLAELTEQSAAMMNPFAPPPPDLFSDATVKTTVGANPFAKPARVQEKPAPPQSPATQPAGVALARGPTMAMPQGPGSPAPAVADVFASSAAAPVHPITLPAGMPTPPPGSELPRSSPRPPTAPPPDPLGLIESPRPKTPLAPRRPGTPPPPPPPDDPTPMLRKAQDLMAFADHSGALTLLDRVLEVHPLHIEANRLRAKCESTLLSMFESKLGDLNRRPSLRLRADEVIWLNLDHRAGFVLSQIDGSVSLDDLFALSGMSRLDTARILAQLVEEKVITTK